MRGERQLGQLPERTPGPVLIQDMSQSDLSAESCTVVLSCPSNFWNPNNTEEQNRTLVRGVGIRVLGEAERKDQNCKLGPNPGLSQDPSCSSLHNPVPAPSSTVQTQHCALSSNKRRYKMYRDHSSHSVYIQGSRR